MSVIAYVTSTPAAKMLKRRRARRLDNGAYEVISRDGQHRYRVFVLRTGDTICNCQAGRIGRTCWHAVRALKRHAALEASHG